MRISRTIRWAAAGLALAGGTALAGAAIARPDGGDCDGHGKRGHDHDRLAGMERRVDELGLDDATLEAVTAVLDDARREHKAFRDELRTAHEQMHELLAQPDADEAAVMAQVEATSELHTEAHKARLRSLLALRDLLTTEQWQQLQERPEGPGGWRRGPPSSS